MGGSSYQALSQADRDSYSSPQPSSADLAAGKPAGPPQNPHGEKSPDANDPRPKKDGADNSPQKDGAKNPPKKVSNTQPTAFGGAGNSPMGTYGYGDR